MLWERFAPRRFSDIACITDDCANLQCLARDIKTGGYFPHIIVYGPPHSGKYTKVRCFLEDIYGGGVYDTQEITHTARQNCTNYTIRLQKSAFHYETSFTGLQYADRSVLGSLIETQFSTVDVSTRSFKILVIRNFEELTKPAQYAMRRQMETGVTAVRYIFICNRINAVEQALVSRCLAVRCGRLRVEQIQATLRGFCKAEGIEVPDVYLDEASRVSHRNLGHAVHLLHCMIACKSHEFDCPVELATRDLVLLLREKTYPADKIRERISSIQLSHISHSDVFRNVIRYCETVELEDTQLFQISEKAAQCNHMMSITNKYSIGMETFIAKAFKIIHGGR